MADDLEQQRVAALEKIAHAPIDQSNVAISIFNQLSAEMRRSYDRRIAELLAANNVEVERRRKVEIELAEARTLIGSLIEKIIKPGREDRSTRLTSDLS